MTNHARSPYGFYSLPDCVIVHDRKYRPLVAMRRTGPNAITLQAHTYDLKTIIVTVDPSSATLVPADTWIEHDDARDAWFYRDKTSPRRCKKTRETLMRLIESTPVLATALKAAAHVQH